MPRDFGPLAWRSALLMIGWIILGLTGPVDLAVGIVVAVVAAWVSLTVLPSAHRALSAKGIVLFGLRFVTRSLMAGVDVARRVLASPVRVRPGVRAVTCAVPVGEMRQFFCSVSSLQPGILPLGGGEAFVRVHALDIDGPIESDLAADAAAFLAMYRTGSR